MSASALILFAHGARDPAWAAPFERVLARVRAPGAGACADARVSGADGAGPADGDRRAGAARVRCRPHRAVVPRTRAAIFETTCRASSTRRAHAIRGMTIELAGPAGEDPSSSRRWRPIAWADVSRCPAAQWPAAFSQRAPCRLHHAQQERPLCLDGRARDRPVRAEHAAVARLRAQHVMARLALVEPLAGVRRHRLALPVPAMRACQRRLQDNGSGHDLLAPTIVAGKPAFAVARASFSGVTFSGSYSTVATLVLWSMVAVLTPGTASSAFRTVIGQAAQYMPCIDRFTRTGSPALARKEHARSAGAREIEAS